MASELVVFDPPRLFSGIFSESSLESRSSIEDILQDDLTLRASEFGAFLRSRGGSSLNSHLGGSTSRQRSMAHIVEAMDGIESVHGLIGFGSYGQVFKATLRGRSSHVAVKVWASSLDVHACREKDILVGLEHPNLVRFFHLGDFPSAGMILEYCEGGDLHELLHLPGSRDKLRLIGLPERAGAGRDVALALKYLHAHEVMHRDVKSSNCLLTELVAPSARTLPLVKLSDFNLARFDREGAKTQAVGTTRYMSPEVMEGGEYSLPVDVFSFGILLHEVITGQEPFSDPASQNMTEPGLTLAIASGHRPPLTGFTRFAASGALRSIIISSWSGCPEERPTAAQVVERLDAVPWTI